MKEGLLTVITYVVLTLLWGSLVVLYLRQRSGSRKRDPLVASLLAVMALDAFKNVVESVFFGLVWGSRYEVLPASWGVPLASPYVLPLPKFFSAVVAIILLQRVAGRVIPDELRDREQRRNDEARLRAEREQTIARVQESERRLQSLFTATTDLVAFWVPQRAPATDDVTWVLESLNPAAKAFFVVSDAVVGADAASLLGQGFAGLLHKAHVAKHPLRRDGTPIETQNGQRIVNTQIVPVVDDNGAVVRIASLSHDITELTRKAEEEEQRTRLESLGLLAGGVAHDFNNLLAVVKADVDLAREATDDDRVLAHAGDAIARARELVEQLMSTAGSRVRQSEAVDLGAVVDDTVRLLRPAQPRVQLSTNTAPGAFVFGDRAQLQQIVLNLLQNACEAVRSTVKDNDVGHVGASVVVEGDRVVVVVSDDGPGIPVEVQARMFEPFFTTKKSGRGLGLSTVFGLAHAHHGTVDVQSEPGSGARFAVTLPLSAAPPKKEPSQPAPRAKKSPSDPPSTPPPSQPSQPSSISPALLPVPSSAEHLRVLLVDDEDNVRRASRRLLERLGHVIHDVASGKEALVVDPASYDVVVIDVTMPELDGPATLLRLRDKRPTLPAVIITGRGDVSVDNDVVLAKPFDFDALQAALERALERARERVALRDIGAAI